MKRKWKGTKRKQEGERKEEKEEGQCCEWFWDFQERYSFPESIVVTWFCYERERKRERGRGRRREREKRRESWFGEAGMAQIVVYNRTGIETRFVAFQLAYACFEGRKEKEKKAKFWHIWSYDTSLKWHPLLQQCHIRNTRPIHACIQGWIHFHFFFFFFFLFLIFIEKKFKKKLKIKMDALLSHFFSPSLIIKGKFFYYRNFNWKSKCWLKLKWMHFDWKRNYYQEF